MKLQSDVSRVAMRASHPSRREMLGGMLRLFALPPLLAAVGCRENRSDVRVLSDVDEAIALVKKHYDETVESYPLARAVIAAVSAVYRRPVKEVRAAYEALGPLDANVKERTMLIAGAIVLGAASDEIIPLYEAAPEPRAVAASLSAMSGRSVGEVAAIHREIGETVQDPDGQAALTGGAVFTGISVKEILDIYKSIPESHLLSRAVIASVVVAGKTLGEALAIYESFEGMPFDLDGQAVLTAGAAAVSIRSR